jgi:hypothetical protein
MRENGRRVLIELVRLKGIQKSLRAPLHEPDRIWLAEQAAWLPSRTSLSLLSPQDQAYFGTDGYPDKDS